MQRLAAQVKPELSSIIRFLRVSQKFYQVAKIFKRPTRGHPYSHHAAELIRSFNVAQPHTN